MPTPVLYIFTDEDGVTWVHVILSKEGTRMGCVLGGILFDLTAHHLVYQPLVEKYTDLNVRALTDDCVPWHPDLLMATTGPSTSA